MCPDPIADTRRGADQGSAPILIRDADERDLPAVAAIFNLEIVESAYVYAEAPLTLDDRRSWLQMHRSASLPVIVATDLGDTTTVLGWASQSPYRAASGCTLLARRTVAASGVNCWAPSTRRRRCAECTQSSRASTARTRRASRSSSGSATSRRRG
jgi:hypothetical protein